MSGESPVGRKFIRARSIQTASASPAAPPASDSVRLSTSNCEIIRDRLAPKARRTAISFCRAVARAIRRFATLAQAISRTSPTTAVSTSSGLSNCAAQVGIALRCRQQFHPHGQEAPPGFLIGSREILLAHFHLEHLVEERLQAGLRLRHGHARFQAPKRIHPPATAVLQTVEFGELRAQPALPS